MKTIAIIQARMSSSRLPGKVLKDIAGKPMLGHVVERVCQAKGVDEVVVATTTAPDDAAIEEYCRAQGIPVYRGSLYDVLDRFYQAALQYQADVVVRVTADCPLIDPGVIDLTLDAFHASGADFAANRLPPPWKRTYPIGLDTEVCSLAALERAWKEATQAYQREHVMPYLYDQDGRFKVQVVDHDPDYGALRWTVDTPEDLEFVRRVFQLLDGSQVFTWLDILALTQQHPELAAINAGVRHKTATDIDERLKPE
ncbi:MAG: glycosyltransferase family protein [Anaerolineaceae bacterium]|nr:glycosyltransferase family protein [Anaerolineaceae bacterium]